MKTIPILFVTMLSNIIPVYSEGYGNVSITKTDADRCPQNLSIFSIIIMIIVSVIITSCIQCLCYTKTCNRLCNRMCNRDTIQDETLSDRIDRHFC